MSVSSNIRLLATPFPSRAIFQLLTKKIMSVAEVANIFLLLHTLFPYLHTDDQRAYVLFHAETTH